MDELKATIAKNLVKLRTDAGYTQLQLGKMLNYSDKAVSKWERAEAIPDLHVLIRLADIYGVTLDYLVHDNTAQSAKPGTNIRKRRILISILSVGLAFFVATVIFTILFFIPSCEEYAACVYTIAFFASAIILTVFSTLWGNRITTAIATSLIVWSVCVMVHVFCVMFNAWEFILDKMYVIYLVGLAFQILIIIWFVFRQLRQRHGL